MDNIIESDNSTMEQCGAAVRWVPRSMMQAGDMKLQQIWAITKYKRGVAVGVRMEWRDVPTATE